MRENAVKRRLAEGGATLGTFAFGFNSPFVPRIAAGAGAEFIVVDQEHSGWGLETVRVLVGAARAAGIVPLVRVPAVQYHLVAGALDTGALGVMAPMVESPEQARALVEFASFPPRGRRGVGVFLHDDLEQEGLAATLERVVREQLLIAQIETAAGIEQVEEIAAVDGIDVLWLGHFDLSTSLGMTARFDEPAYRQAVDRLVRAADGAGKALGLMVASVADGREALARGFRALSYWGDVMLYGAALREGIAELQAAGEDTVRSTNAR